MRTVRRAFLLGISPLLLLGCGDDLAADTAVATQFEQTIPRPAATATAFAFDRALSVEPDALIRALRVSALTPDATLDAITQIEVRVTAVGYSSTLVHAFDAALPSGALSAVVPVSPNFHIADVPGYAPDADWDTDFVNNDVDNCPQTLNATQEDGDQDGVGTACDVDDADPSVGEESLPDLQIRFRVFADPELVPDNGLLLEFGLAGSSTLEIVL